MIKTLKNVKRFFCFVVVFLLVAFSFACKGNNKPATLATPKVTISDSGLASWERVENASSYKFTINNGDEQEIFELQIQLADGDVFSVKAVSSSSEYLDSEFSSPLKYEKKSTEEKLATPVVKIDANGLAKWEKIENATSYKISINGSNEYINVEKIEYQLSDLETISVCAVSNSDNFTNSDFSKEEKWIETIGDGTKNNPYTVGDAIKLINNKYSDGNESEEEFYFLGTVSGTPTSSDLISYRFDLVDGAGNSIVAFNINSNNIGFGANSEVVICAKLQNYGNKTPELVNGKLIMSTNVPVEIEEVTIKKLLEIGVSTKQYKITGVVSNIVNTTYGNFDLVDGEDKIYIYGLLTDKLEGKKFSSLNIFEGDTLTVIGNVVEYNGNLQIKNAVFVKVENKDATIAVNPLENGAIDEIPSTIKKGTTIRFSVTPNEGYAVGKVLANGEEISATQGYYEVVVDKDITISVEFVKEGFIPDTTKKYVFKDYPAGVQYALNEEHVLDDNVKVLTNDVHFTQELRLYSSSSHNGYAIFSLSKENLAYKGIILNAGYNETNLGIYGSVDGEKYELIKEIVVGKSYANYTIDFKTKLYKYIKLDPTLDKQIRIKDITLTFGENKVHEHEFNEKWSADEATHYHECYCGEKKDIASHTFVWVIDKEPTNDENGIKHEECTICNHKQNEGTVIQKLSHIHEWIDATCETAKTCKTCGEVEGAPLGHDYDIINIEWKWSTFSSAIATVKCKRDGNHTFLINGTISSQIIRKPTCALEGVLIYMARISLDGIEYGDVKTVNIPKTTDHYYEDGECVVCHKILTKSIFTKVTDVSQLSEGDIIVLVSEKSSAVAKALAGKAFFNSGEYSSSIDDGNPIEIILGKKGEDWTLTTTEGVIGTTAVKKLNAKGNGTITWKISFDADGDAIIASTNSEYGRFLYNVNNPRFLNYASSVNDTMLLPQIYKYVKAKCNHNFGPLSPFVPATCVKEGVKAHYHCSICDKDYDENAKLLKDLTISKIPHDYVDGRCSVCGKIDPSEHELDFENIIWTWSGYTNAIAEIICKDNDVIKEIITATITSEITKVATCKENGINTYTATIEYDGVKYTNVVTEETTSNKHQYVENICSVCGNEITESEILDALFALGKNKQLDGTYKLTGVITKINTKYSSQYKNITVTIKVGGKSVQCFRLAGDGVENLAVCDKITVSGVLKNYNGTKEFDTACKVSDIVKNAHAFGKLIDEVLATCTTEGTKAHYYCEICKKNYDENNNLLTDLTIAKLEHNYGTLIPEVAATCTTEGTKAHYHCDSCNKNFDENKEELDSLTIEKLDHTYGTDWASDENQHYHECSCGAKADASDHNFIWITDKEATVLETGLKHEECETCGYKRNEGTVIPKVDHEHDWIEATCTTPKTCSICSTTEGLPLKHDYAEPQWTWSAECDKAVAKFVCKRDSSHVEEINATVTSTVYKEATCSEAGGINYQAEVYFLKPYTSLNRRDIPATGKHTCVDNVCSVCSKEITESEILNALFALEKDGKLEGTYKLTGIIIKINTAYLSKYKNITVTIKVGDKEIQCFRLAGGGIENLAVCDKITVSGELIDYNGTKEFGANCQLVSVEANQHNYGTFVDEVPATCKQEGELGHYHCDLCGKNFDVNKEELETIVIKKPAHNFVDGECTACGEKEGTQVTSKYTKVTDASTLKAGDQIVFASQSKGLIIGELSSAYLIALTVAFSDTNKETISTLPEGVLVLTLNKIEENWELITKDGKKLGATAVKKLAFDSGNTTWTISISNGDATIQSAIATYGRFLCNVGSKRFTTYTSPTNASMLLPQIYKYESSATSCEHDYGTLIAEIPASCNAEGTIAHYECSKCHKYFDKNKNEVDSLTIEKSNSHNFVNGECTVCGEKETKKTLSADFTTKESESNSYADSWHYGGFTIKGAANYNGGWAFVKFGGNATNLGKCNPVYIVTTDEVNFAVNEITVSIIAGSLAKNGMKVNSWGVKVQNASGNLVDTVYGGTITGDANIYTFKASDGVTWEKGYKYTVFFDLSNTTKTNGVIWVDKITLSE